MGDPERPMPGLSVDEALLKLEPVLPDPLYRSRAEARTVLDAVAERARAEALNKVAARLRAFNPGGRWRYEGYEDEAVSCVEEARAALAKDGGER